MNEATRKAMAHIHGVYPPIENDTFASRQAAFLKERAMVGVARQGSTGFMLPPGWRLVEAGGAFWFAPPRLVRVDGSAIFADSDPDKWLGQIALFELTADALVFLARGRDAARIAELERKSELAVTTAATEWTEAKRAWTLNSFAMTDEVSVRLQKAEHALFQAVKVVTAAGAADDTGPKADYHGPDDAVHRAVHNVTEHLLSGRVSDTKARRGLRDALDKADRPAEGRKASDQAIGRATRMPDATMSSVEPGYRYDPATNRTYGVPVVCQGVGLSVATIPAPAPARSAKPPLPAGALGRSAPQIGLRLP